MYVGVLEVNILLTMKKSVDVQILFCLLKVSQACHGQESSQVCLLLITPLLYATKGREHEALVSGSLSSKPASLV